MSSSGGRAIGRDYSWREFKGLFGETSAFLASAFPNASTFFDVGCAKGFLIRTLRESSKEAWGCEVSDWAHIYADEFAREFMTVAAGRSLLPRRAEPLPRFAASAGWTGATKPETWLPIAPNTADVTAATVIIAPGSKTGEMANKRWPHFAALAARLGDLDVAVVGTPDDVASGGERLCFPANVRSFVGTRSLRETASLLAGAGVVVANDNGLAHVAAAVGTPTITLSGPTSEHVLGTFARHQEALRAPFPCAPC